MKTGLSVVRVIRTASHEFTSAEYILLLGTLIVTCAAASHLIRELSP
ncbi:MAG: hypothetical protein IIB57_09725 [Planctomycetes bacterium]|nr:hypothetical protein [Planctomycetota bacterium]MCH9033957.1 hypothetical protein [Planctomycetota bacterium]